MKGIDRIADRLRRADRVLFITGAGMSADSGLPTYRGIGGLYEERLTPDEVPIEEALSGEMLRSRPGLTWRYLREIGRACQAGRPNRGHEILAGIERTKPGSWVLTQNVDGFHHAAGTRNLIEIHGRMSNLFCVGCDHRTLLDDETLVVDEDGVPRCPRCGGLIRPDVVLFGEALPERAVQVLLAETGRGFDMIFSIGTSSLFPYIADPVVRASRAGIPTVEINPEETPISRFVEIRLKGGAAEMLERIGRAVGDGE